jgi:cytochrome c biogenesis protein CcdA/glutaredoxin
MRRFLISSLSILFLFAGFSQSVVAQQEYETDLLFFYGQGCPHCAVAEIFLDELAVKYPLLNIFEYETYFNRDNGQLFQEMADAFDSDIEGVPTIFINGKMIVGFSNALSETVEAEVQRCIEVGCDSPLDEVDGVDSNGIIKIVGDSSPSKDPGREDVKKKLTIPAVVGAAVVDAINPCAFAVLIILMTTILAASSKRRALFSGLAFSLSIFISYFLMGLGLYSAIQAAGITHGFYIVVSVLAILVGLFNLKDYFWYGKWFVMEVPMSWRPKLKSLIKGITSVPGAFLIGFAVSLFLLPCTSGPYIVILGLLASATERGYAMVLLLLYNFIFVLPMLIITGAIYFGFTTTEKAEEWRQGKLQVLHLIAGIIILLLGAGMLTALWLGYL